ncbi:MAG: type II toxin-antitoxin system VapC family toxin [Anaerolineae bacterium]|nr:type II toxin-antitoxin system VapC family toxin [Anaerolineae bacterium]
MSGYYVDTSALIKHYLAETGSTWLRNITDLAAGNVIVVCDLTAVEVFSTLARRQREGTISSADIVILQTRFLADFGQEYLSVALEDMVLSRARDLLNRYPLRSLDAIQLASGVEATTILGEPMTFLSSDKNLLNAAISEGFLIDNPNNHP